MISGVFSSEALHSLKESLTGPKPGPRAQLGMSPDPRPGHKPVEEVEGACFKAGVLVLLYPWKEKLHLVLTQRTELVDFHQAQVSFPGGQQEKSETFEQTALREAREELGISLQDVRILGELTPLYIPPSNFCIYPVVAASEVRPNFRPFAPEVAEVIEVPLDHLLDSRNVHKEVWRIQKAEHVVPFYLYKEHKIWGATAMVLAELLVLLRVIYRRA